MQTAVSGIEKFMQQAEAGLREQIIGAQIHASAVGVVDAPQVAVWKVQITKDQVSGLKKLYALKDAIAHVLKVDGVRIIQERGHVAIEVPKPKGFAMTPNASKKLLAYAKANTDINGKMRMEIPVGINNDMDAVTVDPTQHGVVAWIGPSRRGKTQAMKSFLYMAKQAAPNAQFYIFGLHAKLEDDWRVFEKVDGCLGLIGDFDQMIEIITELETLVQTRPRKGRPLFIILDDLTALPANEFGKSLGKIAVTGAGLGYHLMIGTHAAGSKQSTGDSMVENTMTARIIYRPATNSTGARAAGMSNADSGAAELSRNYGDAIYMEHGHITRVSTPFVSDQDIIDHLPRKSAAQRPQVAYTPEQQSMYTPPSDPKSLIPEHWPTTPAKITEADEHVIWQLHSQHGYTPTALADGIALNGKNRRNVSKITEILEAYSNEEF